MRAFLIYMPPQNTAMGRNERSKCYPMSGDFVYDDEYTPTIDDNLTHGKVERQQRVSTRPDTQGVMSSQTVFLSA